MPALLCTCKHWVGMRALLRHAVARDGAIDGQGPGAQAANRAACPPPPPVQRPPRELGPMLRLGAVGAP